MIVLLLIFHLLLLSNEIVSGQKPSPCPEVFSYEPKSVDEDRWFGIISLRTPDDLTGVWITIELDKPADLLGNWFGESVSTDNKEFRISNPDYKLEAGPPVSIRFFVKYDRYQSVPSLKEIRLNGKTICSSIKDDNGPTTPKLHISRPEKTAKPDYSLSMNSNRPFSTSGSRPASRPGINKETGGISSSRPISRPSTSHSITGDVYDRESEISTATYSNVDVRRTTRPGTIYSSRSNNSGQSVFPSYSTDATPYSNSGGNSNTDYFAYNKPNSNNQGQFSGSISRPSSPSTSINDRGENYNSGQSSVYERPHREEGNGQSSVSLNNQHSYNRYPEETDDEDDNPGIVTRPPSHRPVGRPSGSNFNSGGNSQRPSGTINRPSSTGNNLSDRNNDDTDFFPGDFANIERPAQNRPASRPQTSASATNNACGVVAARPSPLISNGQDTTPGQWPWHAALYHSKGIQLIYICGATLISDRHIITAAHCVTKPHSNKVVDNESILVYLGKYNLVTFGPEVQDRDVSDIFVNPEYNHSVYFNDIAILKLSRPVETTNFVRPCCLWSEEPNLDSIINKQGTVVGWGFDEHKKLSNKLMQAQMPVVSTVKCIYSNREFFSQFTFEKNFCAGFRNGTSVCNGDSGGGMVFPKKGTRGQSTVWQLRGIVSVGVALQGQGICDTSQYIVFTDVAKHLSWIRNTLSY